jgi:hypothetical protein
MSDNMGAAVVEGAVDGFLSHLVPSLVTRRGAFNSLALRNQLTLEA